MKKLNHLLALAGVGVLISLGTASLMAQDQPRQGRGNFDPEQMPQRMMDRYREQLEIKGDDEWKVVSQRINKVVEARREVGFGGGPGMFGFARGGRPGGDGNNPPASGNDLGRRGPRVDSSPEAEALHTLQSRTGSRIASSCPCAPRASC